jgi:transposase InsO family protein
MPWKEVFPMDERLRFAIIAGKGTEVFCDLCKEYGISPKTGYKWLHRYEQLGSAGMRELSRRPHESPNRTKAAVEELVVRARRKRPKYGPKKLYELLVREHGPQGLPAVSTIAKIIAKRGLAGKRGRRPRKGQIVRLDRPALTQASRPNEVWAVDFKGWFKTGDGSRCDPLTVTDLHSRFVICVKAVPAPTQRVVRRVFSGVFRKYGLPEAIRVDNGPPFASLGLAGLSKLSVWWTRLGIRVEFIRPASPQMNGSHERMHRTLKAEATQPASDNLRAQQRRFDRWRQRFNHERPHEAIGMRRPADLYQPSSRRYNGRDKMIKYPKDYIVRPVSSSGYLRYGGTNYFVGEAFAGALIGLHKNSSHETELYFANKLLGKLETQVQARFRPTASIGPAPEPISA